MLLGRVRKNLNQSTTPEAQKAEEMPPETPKAEEPKVVVSEQPLPTLEGPAGGLESSEELLNASRVIDISGWTVKQSVDSLTIKPSGGGEVPGEHESRLATVRLAMPDGRQLLVLIFKSHKSEELEVEKVNEPASSSGGPDVQMPAPQPTGEDAGSGGASSNVRDGEHAGTGQGGG